MSAARGTRVVVVVGVGRAPAPAISGHARVGVQSTRVNDPPGAESRGESKSANASNPRTRAGGGVVAAAAAADLLFRFLDFVAAGVFFFLFFERGARARAASAAAGDSGSRRRRRRAPRLGRVAPGPRPSVAAAQKRPRVHDSRVDHPRARGDGRRGRVRRPLTRRGRHRLRVRAAVRAAVGGEVRRRRGQGRSIQAKVGVELKGVRSGVERRRGRVLKARCKRRDAPGKVLKERRSPRERGRMGTSV